MHKNTAIALREDDVARMLKRAADELPGPRRDEVFARVARIDAMLLRLRRVPLRQAPPSVGQRPKAP